MSAELAFQPDVKSAEQIDNTVLSVTTSNQRVAVLPGSILRLCNTHATATANINFGSVAVAAVAANDMIILPSTTVFIKVPNNANYMAYIGSGALSMHMTKGF